MRHLDLTHLSKKLLVYSDFNLLVLFLENIPLFDG
jgi:hypothetical protein